ncbi:Methylthioribulose-1-phosphate dehydratase [Madurella fahalii]|uniref:Methylthioribulose-1-phosphate dehydratase n=1 Tax=Madurella fahalii TaxID=1157608 RepID=A0ABQ0GPW1_9PEZI
MVAANITRLLATYITALHILHYHNILDGYGHMSLWNPENTSTFYMFHTGAPALVSSLDDIALERFIHSEILKRYSGINVVLHGHPDVLVSYSIIKAPLRATIHMAGYLGQRVPVFDISQYYLPNDTQDLLVRNERLGAALAAEFSDGGAHEAQDLPDHDLVLMQSHGFASCGVELEKVVYQAIYAKTNANVESEALRIQHAYGGLAAGDEHGANRGIVYLTPRQMHDTWATIGRKCRGLGAYGRGKCRSTRCMLTNLSS